jgi:hypothetical protein
MSSYLYAGATTDRDWGPNFPTAPTSGFRFSPFIRMVFQPVSPARYSNVQKVVFWAMIQPVVVGAADSTWRLTVRPSTVDAVSRAPISRTLAPDSSIGGSTDPFPFPDLGVGVSPIPYEVPAANGNAFTVPAAGKTWSVGDGAMLYVEFDRFDPDPEVQDFWQDWDNTVASGVNEYLAFAPVMIKDNAVIPGGNTDCGAFGITVVQAPTSKNKTCKYRGASQGWVSTAASKTTYNNPVRDLWQYHADEWDGLDHLGVMVRGFADILGGASPQGIAVRVQEFDSGSDQVGVTIYEQTFDRIGDFHVLLRTENLLSLLTDGKFYGVDVVNVLNGGANSGVQRWPQAWWEVIQSGHTKTVTYHDMATGGRAGPKENFAGTKHIAAQQHGDGTGAFFDPMWYEDLPDAAIRRAIFWTNQNRFTQAHTNSIQMRTDASLDSVDGNLSGGAGTGWRDSGGTAASIGPVNSTALPSGERDFIQAEISDAGSPINLLGARKVQPGLVNPDAWNAGTNDSINQSGFYYAYTVLATEQPELGPLFELDAFDPEGCAATSAGLGEPGLLIITNGSSLPQKYNPIEGTIEDAGIPTPFRDEVPSYSVANIGGSPDGLGLTDGTYVYRYTFRNCCTGKESDPNPDDITVTVSASPKGQVTLNFNGVCIPGDPQICEICVYRTVNGGSFPVMAKVGCFNPDEASTFVDDLGDENLDFVNEALSILNAPMPCVPFVVDFRNRLFGAGDIPSLSPSGTVSVVKGSTTVTGDFDVTWTRCLEGKFIQVEGDCRWYEIERVLPASDCGSPAIQYLELVEPYEGSTQTGADYLITGRPNRLYYSEPFEPECWPVVNFIDVEPGDGDRITGLASNFDRLVVCKRNKTYILAFRDIPALEVSVPARVSSDIGCIAPRSFAQVEVGTVWLSDRGLALYDGRGVAHVPESEDANSVFTDPDDDRYVRRDANGRVIDAVGVWYPKREQYLLLLPTVQTQRGCNLMLVWDVKNRNVTFLEFCQEFQSMVVAKDTDGNERVYLGDTNGFVWIFDVGDADGVGTPGATGTVRGTVTGAGVDSVGASYFDDSSASFLEGGLPGLAGLSGFGGLSGSLGGDQLALAGVCVYLREDETSEWVQRTVFASSPTRIWVTPSWGSDTPEVGWEYMLGPIDFQAEFKPTNMLVDDTVKRNWAQYVVHEPEDAASELRVELWPDFTTEDPGSGTIAQPDGTVGNRNFLMDWKLGRQKRPVGRDIYAYVAVKFSNFAPEAPIRIINHLLGVEAQRGK